jgi:hypothetical protein
MNWPKDSGVSPAVEVALNTKIQEFLDANAQPNGGENGQEVQGLIIDLYLIYKNATTPIEAARLKQEIIAKGSSWDTDDPALDQIQKYLNRIFSGQFNTATEYLDNAITHNEKLKAAGATEIIQKNGRDGAVKRHEETNQILEQAKQYYLENRNQFRSKKQAAIELSEKFPNIAVGTFVNKLKKW